VPFKGGFKEADSGYYLAPLRLLALEGYETLKEMALMYHLLQEKRR